MITQELLNYFQPKQDEILQLIRQICEIESPSYDISGSREVVDFLAAEFEKLKCVDSIERIFAESYGEHLIIRAFQNLAEKQIFLLGHTDTVHPRGSLAERPFKIEDDKVFAPGIFDMKSNCILILEILRAFDELSLKPSKPITILLSCDEEIGSDTGRQLVEIETVKSAFSLVCEPSSMGRVKTGRKGTAGYTVKAKGIPAHAGLEPEKGVSAILEIARQVPIIQALADNEKETTVNVCLIKGGTATNVIPEFAECTVDVRFTRMDEAERIEKEIKSLKAIGEKASLEVLGYINRPPLERDEKVLDLYEKASRVAAEMNYELGETQVGGASDGNFVGALGVPVLDGLGIKGDGAHTNFEHILASDIPYRSTLMARLILDL